MGRLTGITQEMAERLLAEVDYGNHFQGTKYHPMAGGSPVVFMELQEACDFLHVGSLRSLLTLGGGGTVHYIDLRKLQRWIAEVFEDGELAGAIGEEIEKGEAYAYSIAPIKELIEERLRQCRSLLPE